MDQLAIFDNNIYKTAASNQYINDGSAADFRNLILEIEKNILTYTGLDMFETMFKLIFMKLFDEWRTNKENNLESLFSRRNQTASELTDSIAELFDAAKTQWSDVFPADSQVGLESHHLAECVSLMEHHQLLGSDLDVLDHAFEFLINKSSKSSKGQFFTPRWIVDMCIKMLNPKPYEYVMDPACGSSGFLLHSVNHVSKSWSGDDQTVRQNKTSNYVNEKVFGIDYDQRCVRIARCLNYVVGDGRCNILYLNSLNWHKWEETTNQKSWVDIYDNEWQRFQSLATTNGNNQEFLFDVVLCNPPFSGKIDQQDIIARSVLAANKKHVSRDALFVERCVDLLKPGGRLAIVLPVGIANNSSTLFIREYILKKCRILAVIGLDHNTFQPHTGVKTFVILLQKWNNDINQGELCEHKNDYQIFFAEQLKSCVTSNGTPILVEKNGELLLDGRGQPMVDHDLYNHDGLTRNGITESFWEFASEQCLSFNNETQYKPNKTSTIGLTVPVKEVKEAERFDPKFFNSDWDNLLNKINPKAVSIRKLKDMVIYNRRGSQPVYDPDGEIPIITSKNIFEGWIDYDSLEHVNQKWYDEHTGAHVEYGDILVYSTGSKYVGRSAVYLLETPAACSNHVNILRLEKENPLYVSFIINSVIGKTQIKKFYSGGMQGELYPKDFAQFLIPIFDTSIKEKILTELQQYHEAREHTKILEQKAVDTFTNHIFG